MRDRLRLLSWAAAACSLLSLLTAFRLLLLPKSTTAPQLELPIGAGNRHLTSASLINSADESVAKLHQAKHRLPRDEVESRTRLVNKFQSHQNLKQPPRMSKELESFKTSCWHANFSPPTPVDHTPLPFLIDQPSLCSGDVFLLLVVHSSIQHRHRRDLTRSTWGSVRNISGDRLVTLFVVGTSSDPSVNAQLKREADTQADLVQADFVDSYRNLTYKHLYWLKWITHNCQSLKFVMKVDDDVMVNVFHLHMALREPMADWKYFISCWVSYDGPVREEESKWYVTWNEWPHSTYPPFCKGLGYLMIADVIPKLHMCAKWSGFLRMDDVFVTGIVASALGIHRVPWLYGWTNEEMHPRFTGPDIDEIVVLTEFGNTVVPTLLKKVWKAMLKYSAY